MSKLRDEIPSFSHSSPPGSLVIVGLRSVRVPVGSPAPREVSAAVVVAWWWCAILAVSKVTVIISISHPGGGRGLDKTATGPKAAMRARRGEDRMAALASTKVEPERADEKNSGQRIASPGNVSNAMECQRETLVDGQPIINK